MPTTGDDASTSEGAEPAAVADSAGVAATEEPSEADAEPFPPALIVKLRAPDRGVARIIGDMSPAQARLGAEVDLGITPAGRHAERSAIGEATKPRGQDDVLSRPHPRISQLPTRGATVTTNDGGRGSKDE